MQGMGAVYYICISHLIIRTVLWNIDLLWFHFTEEKSEVENFARELPWWLSGKEFTCQCRRHKFGPWPGDTPHAVEQLGLWATTTQSVPQSLGITTAEPARHNSWRLSTPELRAPQENPPQREAEHLT